MVAGATRAKGAAKGPAKGLAKGPDKAADKPAKVAFPKKAQPPTAAEFAARLAAPVGKRFQALQTYMGKQGAREELYYYGPRTGWAYRYMVGAQSLCSIVIMQGRLVGIVALEAPAQAQVPWKELSDVARRARKVAHGTPALLWLDVPLDGTGAADFKTLVKAKLTARPVVLT